MDHTALSPRYSHTYTAPGPYTITLVITDSTGAISQGTNNIVVLQSVQAAVPSSQSAAPALTLQQSTVAAPGMVAVNGSGFLPRTPVVVSAVGEPGPVISSSPILTDASGNLTYTFVFDATVPPSQYDVSAREQTSSPRYSNTLTLTLTSQTAPPVASRISPSTVTATTSGQPVSSTFVITGSAFQAQAFVRIAYAATGTYGGASHVAGDTAATITAAQINTDGSSLIFSVSLYAANYTVLVVNPDGQSTGPLSLAVTASASGNAVVLTTFSISPGTVTSGGIGHSHGDTKRAGSGASWGGYSTVQQ